jgi:hypothetical protein
MKFQAASYLVKDGIFGLEASASKLYNLLIRTWLLSSKLIAWECQNLQTCRGHGFKNLGTQHPKQKDKK